MKIIEKRYVSVNNININDLENEKKKNISVLFGCSILSSSTNVRLPDSVSLNLNWIVRLQLGCTTRPDEFTSHLVYIYIYTYMFFDVFNRWWCCKYVFNPLYIYIINKKTKNRFFFFWGEYILYDIAYFNTSSQWYMKSERWLSLMIIIQELRSGYYSGIGQGAFSVRKLTIRIITRWSTSARNDFSVVVVSHRSVRLFPLTKRKYNTPLRNRCYRFPNAWVRRTTIIAAVLDRTGSFPPIDRYRETFFPRARTADNIFYLPTAPPGTGTPPPHARSAAECRRQVFR